MVLTERSKPAALSASVMRSVASGWPAIWWNSMTASRTHRIAPVLTRSRRPHTPRLDVELEQVDWRGDPIGETTAGHPRPGTLPGAIRLTTTLAGSGIAIQPGRALVFRYGCLLGLNGLEAVRVDVADEAFEQAGCSQPTSAFGYRALKNRTAIPMFAPQSMMRGLTARVSKSYSALTKISWSRKSAWL